MPRSWNSLEPETNVRVIQNFELDDVFLMGKRRESLEELYELCDNSSYSCSSYAEFTVLFFVKTGAVW